MRSWEYNRFGVLMAVPSLASCPRWLSLRGYSWPMITLFSLQGDFCATALTACAKTARPSIGEALEYPPLSIAPARHRGGHMRAQTVQTWIARHLLVRRRLT